MNLIKSNQKRNIFVIIRCFIHTYETYYQELFTLLQDFLKKSPFRERKTIDERIFEKGFRWAEPSEESFKRQIRKVYEEHKAAKTKAREMMKDIRNNFNSVVVKKQYDELFEKCVAK